MEEDKEPGEKDKEPNEIAELNAQYKTYFSKLRDKMKDELTLTDSKIHNTMMTRGHNHEYYVSLLVEEKRKLKEKEATDDRLYKGLIKHYMSPSAKIQAKSLAEAKEYASRDDRYIKSTAEINWRQMIVEYLVEMNKILNKQYFTVGNIIDWYRLDRSSMVSKMKEDDDREQ